jgi:hypothetical protein
VRKSSRIRTPRTRAARYDPHIIAPSFAPWIGLSALPHIEGFGARFLPCSSFIYSVSPFLIIRRLGYLDNEAS